MKIKQYKLITILLVTFSTVVNAQKYDKKYNEEFNTNKDVVISIDSRHVDVEIETWNKNRVEVEATIEIEGTNDKRKKEIIDNWNFKALGNKNEVSITSKSTGLIYPEFPIILDKLESQDFGFDFEVPDVSIQNLKILDSLHTITPDVLEITEPFIVLPEEAYHFSFDSMPFDYEKYKKDPNYLKEWQEKMKQKMEKMKIEWKENAVIAKENAAKIKEDIRAMQAEREKAMEERKKQLIELKKQRAEVEKQRAERNKQRAKIRKEIDERRREELAERRIEIKKILEERDKIKIKRVIKIKAPKDAKFNMNVKYGSISFPN